MIVFILLNLPVIIFSCLITRCYFSRLEALDRLFCSALLYFVYIVAAEQLLGIAHCLTLENLLLANAGTLALTWMFIRRKDIYCGVRPDTREMITAVFSFDRLGFFVVAMILGFSLVKLWINLINPPFGWDSLNYHFTFAVEWLKQHNLNTPLVISDNPSPSYYPINASLVYLWFIYPFHNVFLADIGQAPFFALVFLNVYAICRKLNTGREYSFLAAALMTVTPNYFRQLSIAYVDIMVCAWFLMALNFLLNLREKIDARAVALFALSLGMLIGTKTIALAYSLILAIFFLYLLFRRGMGLRAIFMLCVFFACALITGGFAYARNFLLTGNPLYPSEVLLFGQTIFRGVMDKADFTVFSRPWDYTLAKALFHEGMGLGTTLFVLPCIILAVIAWFRKKRIGFTDCLLSSVFIFLYLCYRYLFALPNVRYLYPCLGVGYVLCFTALQDLAFPRRLVRFLAVVCLLSAAPEMSRHEELAMAGIVSLALFLVLSLWSAELKKMILRIGVALVCLAMFILAYVNADYNKNEFRRYIQTERLTGFWPDATRGWEWLNRHTQENNIAYVGRPVPFPLYGTRFKNNVYYVSLNSTEPARLHDFPGSRYSWNADFLSMHQSFEAKGNYRYRADYSVWLKNLSRRSTDYLFVYSLHQTKKIIFPLEDKWAALHPDKFLAVFNNPTVHIYKLKKVRKNAVTFRSHSGL